MLFFNQMIGSGSIQVRKNFKPIKYLSYSLEGMVIIEGQIF